MTLYVREYSAMGVSTAICEHMGVSITSTEGQRARMLVGCAMDFAEQLRENNELPKTKRKFARKVKAHVNAQNGYSFFIPWTWIAMFFVGKVLDLFIDWWWKTNYGLYV